MPTAPSTRSTRSRRWAAAATIVAVTAACGGEDRPPAGGEASPPVTTTEAGASTGPAADATTSAGSTDGGGGDAGGAFCTAIQAQVDQLAQVDDATSEDPARRRSYYTEAKARTAEVRRTAPDDIADDLAASLDLSDAVADGYLAEDPAAIQAATATLTSPEAMARATQLAAAVQERCDIGFDAGD